MREVLGCRAGVLLFGSLLEGVKVLLCVLLPLQ